LLRGSFDAAQYKLNLFPTKMIEGRPRESLVLYDNPIEVSLLLCPPHKRPIKSCSLRNLQTARDSER
jgi:hypothetical protein